MGGLYLLAAFVAGWVSCRYVYFSLVRKALDSPTLSSAAIAKMTHPGLLQLRDEVVAELETRSQS